MIPAVGETKDSEKGGQWRPVFSRNVLAVETGQEGGVGGVAATNKMTFSEGWQGSNRGNEGEPSSTSGERQHNKKTSLEEAAKNQQGLLGHPGP